MGVQGNDPHIFLQSYSLIFFLSLCSDLKCLSGPSAWLAGQPDRLVFAFKSEGRGYIKMSERFKPFDWFLDTVL